MKLSHSSAMVVALVAVALLSSGMPAFAQQQEEARHPTGLRPFTAKQLSEFRRSHRRVTGVCGPTEIGLQRKWEVLARKGLPVHTWPREAAPYGQDLVSTGAEAGEPSQAPESQGGGEGVGALPSYVDNSQLPAFPEIRSQGSLGSCLPFAITYYQLTHEAGLIEGWNNHNTNNATKFSPKWTYNMINGGSDVGSYFSAGYRLLEKHGAATWAEFPYDANYRAWCLDTTAWGNAIACRAAPVAYIIGLNTDAGLNTLKETLNNGHVLVFGTYIHSWQFQTIKNDPSTPADDPFVGKWACYLVNGASGAHAMTIVGYCDDIWVDTNNNNVVETGEKGALRIANSWGTGWRETGFTWLTYGALKGSYAIMDNQVYALSLKPTPPTVVAEFTLAHGRRYDLFMSLGISDTATSAMQQQWTPGAIYYQGGPYAFDGTTTPVDGTFVFDFSDLLQPTNAPQRFYLRTQDRYANYPATLKSYKIIDLVTSQEVVCTNVPQTVDNGQNTVYVDYHYTAFPLTAKIGVNTTSDHIPLLVHFSGGGSYVPEGRQIVSYEWDFGDGYSGSGANIDHTYLMAGQYSAVLTVTDDSSATDSDSVLINALAPNRPPVAEAGGPYQGTAGGWVSFSGAGSSDPDGDQLQYVWAYGDGSPNGTGPYVYHNYTAAGQYVVTLTVSDPHGESSSDTAPATITENHPPVAEAGGPYTGVVNQAVYFTGSGSSDPDGDWLSYQWDWGDGSFSWLSPSNVICSHIYTNQGTYNVVLYVFDSGTNSSDSDTTTATISGASPTNRPPVANAGPDQTAHDSDRNGIEWVTLDGRGSSDPDGQIVAYEWWEGSNILGTGAIVQAWFPVGIHTVILKVTDNNGATASDTVVVTVNAVINQLPVANAGPDQNVTDSDGNGVETVTLDGSASYDPDGTIVAYRWTTTGNIVLGTTAVVTCSFPLGTNNWAMLMVTDNNGATASDLVVIRVTPAPNQAPVANAGPDQSVDDTDHSGAETVTLNGTGSTDSDGTIASYVWQEGAATLGNGATLPVNLAVGVHTITLTVTDNDGAIASDTVVVTVNRVNIPPTANAGPDQSVDDVDYNGSHAVTLNGSASSDADGTLVSYQWKKGTNLLGTAAVIATALPVGTNTIMLTVTDNDGATASDIVVVIVRKIDKLTVSKAEFTRNSKQLLVEAYTDMQGATLTLQGYGTMTYQKFVSGKGYLHKYLKKPVADPLGTVTVTSSKGGTAASAVKYR